MATPKIIQDLMDKSNAEAGRIKCEACSTPNWEAFHRIGECPPKKEQVRPTIVGGDFSEGEREALTDLVHAYRQKDENGTRTSN